MPEKGRQMSLSCMLLSRKAVLAFLGVAALLFGVVMLHPYPRQSLFGPKIRGKPWCVWEHSFRRHVHPEKHEQNLSGKLLRWFGVDDVNPIRFDIFENTLDDPDLLPLALAMAEDEDRDVRDRALQAIFMSRHLKSPSVLSVLQRRLHDDDSDIRRFAA